MENKGGKCFPFKSDIEDLMLATKMLVGDILWLERVEISWLLEFSNLSEFGDFVRSSIMTSSVPDLSDPNAREELVTLPHESDIGEADEQQKLSKTQVQSSSPAIGMSHPIITTSNMQCATPQLGVGNPMDLFALALYRGFSFQRLIVVFRVLVEEDSGIEYRVVAVNNTW
ncbi:unnamed protein product [Ilex paraguariensis]|uniref:Uncharacterized protein n=1 Tax=Ilex paraguariensis TaxID=185542 RepID=A0ABC8RDT8_9AQUA